MQAALRTVIADSVNELAGARVTAGDVQVGFLGATSVPLPQLGDRRSRRRLPPPCLPGTQTAAAGSTRPPRPPCPPLTLTPHSAPPHRSTTQLNITVNPGRKLLAGITVAYELELPSDQASAFTSQVCTVHKEQSKTT